uniref:Uncharacterized protein n=1 Tax=Meloidogyne enterolobii TaxID=390850 RepID=A0A6V7U742_MELEN|nr:unnamed protein product [Meloidogyne enterolobii]
MLGEASYEKSLDNLLKVFLGNEEKEGKMRDKLKKISVYEEELVAEGISK